MPSSVLVVDDDPVFLAIAARILADMGIELIATAADAAQAIEVAQEAKPAAVLVDVGLPDRSGIDLAYELAELPWAPRVVLTSSDSEAFVAIETLPARRAPAFIPKAQLDTETLHQVLTTDQIPPAASA
jgi:DNA-binding NarL/FixJ family response regulator